jgi:hypothetical protein
MNAFLLQPSDACTRLVHAYVACAEMYWSSWYWLSKSARTVVLSSLLGMKRTLSEIGEKLVGTVPGTGTADRRALPVWLV